MALESLTQLLSDVHVDSIGIEKEISPAALKKEWGHNLSQLYSHQLVITLLIRPLKTSHKQGNERQ